MNVGIHIRCVWMTQFLRDELCYVNASLKRTKLIAVSRRWGNAAEASRSVDPVDGTHRKFGLDIPALAK